MKLSTRSRYGCRLMFALAKNFNKRTVQLNDISKNEGLSEKYLGQIVHRLKRAGFINAERGAHGGYFLTKSPDKINLKEIVATLENGLYIVPCVKNPELCNKSKECVFHKVWGLVSENINKILSNITLQDLYDLENGKISKLNDIK